MRGRESLASELAPALGLSGAGGPPSWQPTLRSAPVPGDRQPPATTPPALRPSWRAEHPSGGPYRDISSLSALSLEEAGERLTPPGEVFLIRTAPPDAMHLVQLELSRSRRFQRPLSVVVFDVVGQPHLRRRPRRKARQLSALVAMVTQHVRAFDTVLPGVPSRAVAVVAPETGPTGGRLLGQRIQATLAETGTPVHSAVATFPDDGALLTQLLETAAARLRHGVVAGPGADDALARR